MTKRILLINENGTAEVNGVKCKLVPVEPTETMLCAAESSIVHGERDMYRAMLSAVTIDLNALSNVPERLSVEPRDTDYDEGVCAGYNAALDAMGVK